MPNVTAIPSKAAWSTPSAAVTITAGLVVVTTRPAAQWTTPAARAQPIKIAPAKGGWSTPAAAFRVLVTTDATAAWKPATLIPLLVGGTIFDTTHPAAQWHTNVARVQVTTRQHPAAQWHVLAPSVAERVTGRPSTAQWHTMAATVTVPRTGRQIPLLTEALARIAAGLPLTDAQRNVLPPEYANEVVL